MSASPQIAGILYRRVFDTLRQCGLCFSIWYRLLYLLHRRCYLLVQELLQLLLLTPFWYIIQRETGDLARGLGARGMARKGQLLRPKRRKIGESFLNAFKENCDVQQTFLDPGGHQ